MTEQPPSAESLREWLRDSIMLHRSRPYAQDFVNEAMEHINAYAERACKQRVSDETERCARIAAGEGQDHSECQHEAGYMDGRLDAAAAIRAPAERPAPPQQKEDLPRRIGVEQPTQETRESGCGTEAGAHPLDAEIRQALQEGERLGAQLRRDAGHDTLRDRIMYPPSALASTGEQSDKEEDFGKGSVRN